MEEPEFGVMLAEAGNQGLEVIGAVRVLTGLSAWRSGQLLKSAPTMVVEGTWFEAAVEAVRSLNVVGARAELVCGWCQRVMPATDCPVDPEPCSSPYLSPTGCPASRPGS